MITVTGEVRKVYSSDYTNKKTGEIVSQSIVILEPKVGRDNHEIFLNSKQISKGAVDAWKQLKGKQASVDVSLFVNYPFKFYKFTAESDGLPKPAK